VIDGRVLGVPPGAERAGLQVELLRFQLDAQGNPQATTLQTRALSGDDGFRFEQVLIVEGAVFQVRLRVAERQVESEPFTFPAGQQEVALELQVPSPGSPGLGIHVEEGLIAVEPIRGAVQITEVLHFRNPTGAAANGAEAPLELTLPEGAQGLQMLRNLAENGQYDRLGDKLVVYAPLPPGRATLAFAYRLPVWLGTATLEKRYPHDLNVLSVLYPEGALKLQGAGFTKMESQQIQGTRYDAWVARSLAANAAVVVRLSGVPYRQEVFLASIVLFLLPMAGVVVWFLRARLRFAQPTD
jgi:hypothetical protein